MALVSPGVQVTVTDQSNYAPNSLASVAYILMATAENKVAPGGTGIAPGTLQENAEKVYTITSQRDLVTTFGTPIFKTTSSGAPINGDEQNEYGLMAAYSLLGVSNTVYVQRANVDLSALDGSTSRPLADPASGSYWLDTTNSNWGIYEWSSATQSFSLIEPIVITDTADLSNGIPSTRIGTKGSYAVVATDQNNPIYFKAPFSNLWKLVGAADWAYSLATITGSVLDPTISQTANIIVNGSNVSCTIGSNVTTVVNDINGLLLPGIKARIGTLNQLVISGNISSQSDGITADGLIAISASNVSILTDLGITAGTYRTPQTSIGPYYSVPNFQGNIAGNAGVPTGSIWHKVSAVGNGLDLSIRKYSGITKTWTEQVTQDYANVFTATYGLDPTGGGLNIPVNSTFTQYDSYGNVTLSELIWYRKNLGPTVGTGSSTTPVGANIGATFTVQTRPSATSAATSTYTVTIANTSVNGFIVAVSAAGIPDVTAALSTTGAMTITQDQGGDLILTDGPGTPLANIGLIADNNSIFANPNNDSSSVIVSNWAPLSTQSYSAAATQPYVAPPNDTYWYYNTPSRVDIMISNGSAWVGYRTLSNDVRGYDLTQTNPTGPIISSSAPTAQDDGSALVYGDLWLDTSDLENYPKLYRWQSSGGVNQWILIDNTNTTGQNGIVFADARWATSGNVNPVTGTIPSIAELGLSSYVDLDAPDPGYYPRGMLLWNTRASGFNVKQYKANYFTSAAYPNEALPGRADAWVTVMGYNISVTPNFGRLAQRGVVVQALKAAIDSSTNIREDSSVFNLIACPSYPELIPNMIMLNDDKNDTSFIIGDSPMSLPATGTDIEAWATNQAEVVQTGELGLATINPYCGVYYPSGQTNDLSGNSIVVPASYAVLRAMIKSDNFSYPWLAPAGTLRGLIDNLNAIGYIDPDSGQFINIGVTQGLRDVLYRNNINPLTNLPGSGLVIYGQKTLSQTATALDRINVARLVCYLRLQLNTLARPYVFEPNDPITRNSIKAVVSQALNDIVAKRGISDYLVVCDSTNNTPERIARNELWIDVAIQPIQAAEFIYIPIRLKNPGEIQSGNLASAQTVGTGA